MPQPFVIQQRMPASPYLRAGLRAVEAPPMQWSSARDAEARAERWMPNAGPVRVPEAPPAHRATPPAPLYRDHPALAPLSAYLDDEQVTDVFVNGAAGLFVDRGSGAVPVPAWRAAEDDVRALAVALVVDRRPSHRRRDSLCRRALRRRRAGACRAAAGVRRRHRDLDPHPPARTRLARQPRVARHVRAGRPREARGGRRGAARTC